MSSRFFMTMASCLFLGLALHAGEFPRAGPLILRRAEMAKEKEPPAPLTRATRAETSAAKVRLSDFVVNRSRYSFRGDDEFKPTRLNPLKTSITTEGLQVPLEFYRDGQGRPVLIKGHRRAEALKQLAAENVPGFTADMEVDALEVVNATPEEHVLRSLLDNLNREDLSAAARMRAAKVLHDNGIDPGRAAAALGISMKTLERDLRIASHSWMVQHIEDKSITAGDAYRLLEAAENKDHVGELKEDLDAWVAGKKLQIRKRELVQKARTGKELRPAEKEVRKLMKRHLVDHWIELLGEGKRFDDDVEKVFAAGIEADTGELRIEALKLDLRNAKLKDIAKVAAKLSQISQDLIPFLESRSLLDSPDGPQTRLKEENKVYDLKLLREHGLGDLAESLEREVKTDAQPAEEEPEKDKEGASDTEADNENNSTGGA